MKGRRPGHQVFLAHWHQAEARERAERLQGLGYAVLHESGHDGAAGRAIREAVRRVDAVIVDLSRLPSHGRHFALFLRENKATRHLPIVFLQGDREKTARVRETLPDAVFTTWARIGPALAKAIANPPRDPVVPKAPDYSGTPLWKKLGIKAGCRVALLGAPRGFAGTLGPLPEGVKVSTRLPREADVIVLFSKAITDLQRRFPEAAAVMADKAGLWSAWPKKQSGVLTDLDQRKVMDIGLAQGLVDNKICAIDATWSGLRFARRRK